MYVFQDWDLIAIGQSAGMVEEVEVAKDTGDWRTQIVRCIGDEAPLCLECRLLLPVGGRNAIEHPVECVREASHLVVGGRAVDTPIEIESLTNLRCGTSHAV